MNVKKHPKLLLSVFVAVVAVAIALWLVIWLVVERGDGSSSQINSSSSSGVASSSSSRAISSSSSSSLPYPSSLAMNMTLGSSYYDYVSGTTANINYITAPVGGCSPSFNSTTLPNGVVGTAYYNPCATNGLTIQTTIAYTDDFTLMAWGKLNNDTGTNILFCASSTQYQTAWDPENFLQPELLTYLNGIEFAFVNDPNTAEIAATTYGVETGVWNHYAGVYSSELDQFMLYENGAQVGTVGIVSTTWATTFTAKPYVQIGGTLGSGSVNPWIGYIYNAHVYNTTLTASEISSIYAGER